MRQDRVTTCNIRSKMLTLWTGANDQDKKESAMERILLGAILGALTACSSGITVDKSEHPDAWPYAADSVVIDCEQRNTGAITTVKVDGLKYALYNNKALKLGFNNYPRGAYPAETREAQLHNAKIRTERALMERALTICGMGS